MSLLSKATPLGMFVVIKPWRILLFILTWNALGGLFILVNDGLRPLRTPGGCLLFSLLGVYLSFCSIAPLVSEKVRQRWCDAAIDFEEGRTGFVLGAVVGVVLAAAGLFIGIAKLSEWDVAVGSNLLHSLPVAGIFVGVTVLLVLRLKKKLQRGTGEQ